MCAHGGQAMPTVPSPRVSCAEGMPTVLVPAAVDGRRLPGVPPPVPPCVTAQWVLGTVRVTSYGQPLVIDGGVAICAPGGTPLLPMVTQVQGQRDVSTTTDEPRLPLRLRRRRGHTAQTDPLTHIGDMIEQILFTSPGERVNRPTFGSGTAQLVFAPNSDVLAAAQQQAIQAGLQQWLSDLIRVQSVRSTAEEATLQVTVVYTVIQTQQQQTQQFVYGAASA